VARRSPSVPFTTRPRIAALAAGVVVEKHGTATASPREIARFAEQYLLIRGTTPRTREAYQRDLEHFGAFVKSRALGTDPDVKAPPPYDGPARAAYADIAFKLIESGGTQDSTRDLRLRVTVGRGWRVIDAWDTTTGRWLVGEAPQYSALVLESEAPSAVANYLYGESFAAGGNEQFASRPGVSTFLQARVDAIKELNDAFKSHLLVDRHFEGTSVKIIRFDPATYLGDGVLTVVVSGKLLQTDGSGATRTFPFSQQMKFLRSLRGGNPNLNAVDQQSTNGTWDSGGELALYAVDIEFG